MAEFRGGLGRYLLNSKIGTRKAEDSKPLGGEQLDRKLVPGTPAEKTVTDILNHNQGVFRARLMIRWQDQIGKALNTIGIGKMEPLGLAQF